VVSTCEVCALWQEQREHYGKNRGSFKAISNRMAVAKTLTPVYDVPHRDRTLKSAMEVRWNSFLTLLVRNIEQRAAIDGYLNDDSQRSVAQDGDLRACLTLPLTDAFWLESMQLAAVYQRFEAAGSSITSEKVPTLGMYCFAIKSLHEQLTRLPLSFFADIGTKKEKKVITWSHEQLCPRIVKAKSLLYTLVDERWDIARGDRDTQNHALLAAFVDPRFKNDAVWVSREIQMAEDGFIHICSRFKLSGPAAGTAVLSPPRSQASSGLVLRPRAADDYDDDSADGVQVAWRAWMKEEVSVSEGLSCDVLEWWKANSARFPLIAKAAKIVLATPASEAICERLFKRAKHIGTTDRMARLLDDTFEMLVMAQYNVARHGGVETIEVSIISAMTILYCLVTAALAGSWGFLRYLQLTRRASLDGWLQLAFCMLFAAESAQVTRVPLVCVLHAAFGPEFG
jgi:hypothetical protein